MRRSIMCTGILAAVTGFSMAPYARANLLLDYQFGSGTTGSLTATNVASELTAGNFSIDPTLWSMTLATPVMYQTSGSVAGTASTSGFPYLTGYMWNTDESSAHWFGFSVTVADGWKLNIDSLSLYEWSRDNSGVDHGPNAYKLVVSTSSDFSSGVSVLGSGGLTPTSSASYTLISGDADVTGLTGTLYFRIYGWGGTIVNQQDDYKRREWRIDDVQLNGAVTAVPEPASLVLLGAAGVLFACRRRSPVGLLH